MPKIIDTKGTGAPATCERREPSQNKAYTYGLTVRHNPKYKAGGIEYSDMEKRDIYNQLIGTFQAKGLKIDNIYYEHKNGLHFHARATYKKKIYFKAWTYKDCHVMFKKIYDDKGWKDYCRKEREQQTISYLLNFHAFSDSE